MIIGIPRALIYWKRPYFWETFFKELGFEVLLSPKTNKEIVEIGVKISDPETCFSNKVYFGHLKWLEGKVDYIFVPRLRTNKEKLEYCPKFFGIPDVAKILVHPVKSSQSEVFAKGEQFNRVKTSILTETFDERKESFEKTIQKLGKKLKKSKEEVKRAAEISFLKERELKEKKEKEFFKKIKSEKQKIVLISHPYNLYDEYVNLRIKEKIERLGAQAIFIDEIPNPKSEILNKFQIPNSKIPKFHWEFGKEIMEKIEEILKYSISGAIEISSFACGSDAVLKEFVEKRFKEAKIPFLYLIIDEQTGEAGIQTRLEAFVDTLK
jgi:predicted nucleotide-binding protein (sugar kinase/HSP70/actin superfamily)